MVSLVSKLNIIECDFTSMTSAPGPHGDLGEALDISFLLEDIKQRAAELKEAEENKYLHNGSHMVYHSSNIIDCSDVFKDQINKTIYQQKQELISDTESLMSSYKYGNLFDNVIGVGEFGTRYHIVDGSSYK